MKLDPHYQEIKEEILSGLESKNISLEKLKAYFQEVQAKRVEGDFNRACVWVGSQLTPFWRAKLVYLFLNGIDDTHVDTLYRKFFKELKFNKVPE